MNVEVIGTPLIQDRDITIFLFFYYDFCLYTLQLFISYMPPRYNGNIFHTSFINLNKEDNTVLSYS